MAHAKTTPLTSWHENAGANLAAFGDYTMPLWYASAKQEHLTVLTHAGLFDTSHMAGITLCGPQARQLLQDTCCRDLESCIGRHGGPLETGRCVYGIFLNENGHAIDDAIIYQLQADGYLLVINADMGADITNHLQQLAPASGVEIRDCTDQWGKIDLQGPAAGVILQKLLDQPQQVLQNLPYFAFKGRCQPFAPGEETVTMGKGIPVLLSRSGYTGEFGFEIFCQADAAADLWQQIMDIGQDYGLAPCGLAARDSLRAGAVLPLSHQDIGPWPFVRNPWTFVLPWEASGQGFRKPFLGDKALLGATEAPYTYPFVGKDLRKVAADENSQVLDEQDQPLGRITTCATDMGIGWHQGQIYSIASDTQPAGFRPKGLCCGFVLVNRPLNEQTPITLADSRRRLPAWIVSDIRPQRTARRKLEEML